MTPEMPGALIRAALLQLAAIGGPVFGALLVIGLVMGILQAATQINDAAVSFLPRAVAGILVVWFMGGWMMDRLVAFLAQCIAAMGAR